MAGVIFLKNSNSSSIDTSVIENLMTSNTFTEVVSQTTYTSSSTNDWFSDFIAKGKSLSGNTPIVRCKSEDTPGTSYLVDSNSSTFTVSDDLLVMCYMLDTNGYAFDGPNQIDQLYKTCIRSTINYSSIDTDNLLGDYWTGYQRTSNDSYSYSQVLNDNSASGSVVASQTLISRAVESSY